MHDPDIAVLIPALNEEGSIATVLEALPDHVRAIVIDNGSHDATAARAASAGATVVSEPRRGYGRAVLAGLTHLRADPPDIAVVLDADLADDPARLPDLLAPLLRDEADICFSDRTRLAEPGALTPVQRFGNRLAITLIAGLTGHTFRDLGPFRAMRYETWRDLDLEDPTWGFNVEMNLKAVRKGYRIVEISLPYRRRTIGQSKISGTVVGSIRAGYRILATIARHRDAGR